MLVSSWVMSRMVRRMVFAINVAVGALPPPGLHSRIRRHALGCRLAPPCWPCVTRHVAVVGAGAAGLTAALRAAEGGARVTLLNAHPKVGLKILMSGGTRCNVTHREVSERDFDGGSSRFVRDVLRAFDVEATLAWFEALGVALKLEPTGKYFPETDDAQTVLDALLAAVGRAG